MASFFLSICTDGMTLPWVYCSVSTCSNKLAFVFASPAPGCRMWIPPEDKDTVVIHASTRKSITCFGAVSLYSGKFIRMISPIFNAITFETFLKKLLRHRSRNKKMVIIRDNARYHHAKLLKPLLKKHHKHLELLFLPPYSPQLAPVERVWKLTRRLSTHNRYFPSLDEVQTAIECCFDRWLKPNAVLKRLCGII